MKSHEVLRRVCKPMGSKRVAAELGLSWSIVHKWSCPRADGRSAELNPLDRIVTVTHCTGDRRLVEWLCARTGGRFVPNPRRPPPSRAELLRLLGGVLQELGRLQAALAEGWHENGRSRSQAAALRAVWTELQRDMEALLADGADASRFQAGKACAPDGPQ